MNLLEFIRFFKGAGIDPRICVEHIKETVLLCCPRTRDGGVKN